MQTISDEAKKVVMSYIKALDEQNYELAGKYLNDNVRIQGPDGESFKRPKEFVEMLSKYQGRYDVKKSFVDESDVCLFYDLKSPETKAVFTSSWYQVNDGKIISIRTVFDPRQFETN
jgi:hypothetical protein